MDRALCLDEKDTIFVPKKLIFYGKDRPKQTEIALECVNVVTDLYVLLALLYV